METCPKTGDCGVGLSPLVMVAWLTATEANDKLLTSIEPDVLDRYSHFLYGPDDDKTKYDLVYQKFEDHFKAMKRTVFCRYKCV